MFGFTLLVSLLTQPLFGAGVTVRFAGEPSGEGGRFSRALAEEWAQKTGNKVEYIFRPSNASSALQVASESVNCNALEWIYSCGGGSVIEPDKQVTINNPNAIKALDTAHSWIGTISPEGVSTYGEEEARNVWQAGNAAFMRNWPYAYGLGADPKSAVSGKFDVTVLPKGGDNGKNAACLGGWQLMISAYSNVADAAADLVRYLSSAAIQKKIAMAFSVLPTRPALYRDPDVLTKNPFFKIMLDVFNNAVARPSTVTGADYNQLSTALFQNVNEVLTGTESGKDAVVQVEKVANRIVH